MATESDNVNSGALGTLVAVGTIAFFGIALVVTALVRAEMNEELEKKEVSADRAYKDLVAEQTAKLAAPASYVDKGRGLVSLPIDRAMELTVSGLKKDPNSATPPAPIGGTGGAGGADAATAGAGGTGGSGGVGGVGGSEAKPADEATNAEPVPSNEGKPVEETTAKPDEKKDEKKDAKEKKKAPAPKPAAPAPKPAAPAPAAPAPAAPAPNGQ